VRYLRHRSTKKPKKQKPSQPKTPEELVQRRKENRAAYMAKLERVAAKIENERLLKIQIQKEWDEI